MTGWASSPWGRITLHLKERKNESYIEGISMAVSLVIPFTFAQVKWCLQNHLVNEWSWVQLLLQTKACIAFMVAMAHIHTDGCRDQWGCRNDGGNSICLSHTLTKSSSTTVNITSSLSDQIPWCTAAAALWCLGAKSNPSII